MFQKKPEERASLWYNSCISSKTPSCCAGPLQTQLGLAQALLSLSHMKTWSKQQQELCENSGSYVTTPTTLLCGLGTRGGDRVWENPRLTPGLCTFSSICFPVFGVKAERCARTRTDSFDLMFALLSFQGASKPEPRTQRPMSAPFYDIFFLYIVYIFKPALPSLFSRSGAHHQESLPTIPRRIKQELCV